MITGDFNLSGADVRQYAEIRRVMDGLNLRDLWAWDVYNHNPSQGLTCRFTDGDSSGWHRRFHKVCAPLQQPNVPAPRNEYCDDRVLHEEPPFGTGRYDYVFAENPTRAHRYYLEASRILRRTFPLRSEIEGEHYVSDHLGLELTLYCSPK